MRRSCSPRKLEFDARHWRKQAADWPLRDDEWVYDCGLCRDTCMVTAHAPLTMADALEVLEGQREPEDIRLRTVAVHCRCVGGAGRADTAYQRKLGDAQRAKRDESRVRMPITVDDSRVVRRLAVSPEDQVREVLAWATEYRDAQLERQGLGVFTEWNEGTIDPGDDF